jgi:hypothetical protein
MGTWILIKNIVSGEVLNEWGFTIIMPGVCLLFIIFSIRHFYKLSPKVIITGTEIIIGRKRINLDQITIVSVRSKTLDNFLFIPFRYESCSLSLTNGDEVSISVESYFNGNVIRMNFDSLNNYVLGKNKTFTPVESDNNCQITNEVIDTRTAKKYMQTPLKSVNNYIFVGMCGFMIWLMFQIQDGPAFIMLFPILMFSLFYLILVVQNHYFLVTDTHLIVKNLFLPTRRRIFRFDSIDYLETEDLPKQETALKVMTKNFRIYRFQSGLMNYEMYTDLIRTINERQNNGTQQSG